MSEGLRAQKKHETRKTISDVATRLFIRNGFEEVTIADIAAEARVAKMTVTNHFPRMEMRLYSDILRRSRFLMSDLRLGDVIDDYCPRCRLLLNHDIASLTNGEIAKVTCRTCYNTHDYRHGQVPARRTKKKDDTKSLMDQVLAGMPAPPQPPRPPAAPVKKRRDLWAEVERLKKK